MSRRRPRSRPPRTKSDRIPGGQYSVAIDDSPNGLPSNRALVRLSDPPTSQATSSPSCTGSNRPPARTAASELGRDSGARRRRRRAAAEHQLERIGFSPQDRQLSCAAAPRRPAPAYNRPRRTSVSLSQPHDRQPRSPCIVWWAPSRAPPTWRRQVVSCRSRSGRRTSRALVRAPPASVPLGYRRARPPAGEA